MRYVKNLLVGLGPDSKLTRLALQIYGFLKGFRITFSNRQITISRKNQKIVLSEAQYVQVPWMTVAYDMYFETMASDSIDGKIILDFSQPALHRYIKSNVDFWFPSIPEDDVMDQYTAYYKPQAGDIVWDVGAHAGATTYFLSKMVGPTGMVFAFEPDEGNFEYLTRNIEYHQLSNVTPVKKALARTSGTAQFYMDGTMNAGLAEFLTYPGRSRSSYQTVTTVSFADACSELGGAPRFVKLDIEGAETDVIDGARDFLRNNAIEFAIETEGSDGGEPKSETLETIYSAVGYRAWSAEVSGQRFMWATRS